MNKMMTIIRFTFMGRIRNRPFLVTTLIVALIISVLIHLPLLISSFSSQEPETVGILPGASVEVADQLQRYFAQQDEPRVIIRLLEGDEQSAREQIASGQIKGYVELGSAASPGAFPEVVYKSKDSLDSRMKSALQEGLRAIKTEMAVRDAGLTEEQMNRLFAPVSLSSIQISIASGEGAATGKSESQMAVAYALVYALLILLYMGVLGFGNLVATEITAEKSSRVMEVLISSVSPLKQMFGKIIGVCLLSFAQVAFLLAVAAVNLSLPHNVEQVRSWNLSLGDLDLAMVGYFALFYLLGYLIYATLFAAVGSLVSRTEEVGQAIMPVTMLIIIVFMVAMFGLQNPNAPFIVATSFIPFFAPLIMFLRIGMGDPALWEIWLSIGILAASVLLLGWMAAKIYRVGVLLYGKRPSFSELRKAMKAFKV